MPNELDLLAWARRWNWPQLVLDAASRQILRAGEEKWRDFAKSADATQRELAQQRISQWSDRAERSNV